MTTVLCHTRWEVVLILASEDEVDMTTRTLYLYALCARMT